MSISFHTRRLSHSYSQPLSHSQTSSISVLSSSERERNERDTNESFFAELSEMERDEVIDKWRGVFAKDVMEEKVVIVSADTSVEDACDKLLQETIECLVVVDPPSTPDEAFWIGLFDFSDVNAFLTLAATRHTLPPETIKSNERLDRIVEAAKAGRVPVRLVSNFSDKNPFVVLPHDANLISVLEVFARGAHRVFIRNSTLANTEVQSPHLVGMISDKRLLSFFKSSGSPSSTSPHPHAHTFPSLQSSTSTSSTTTHPMISPTPLDRITSKPLSSLSSSTDILLNVNLNIHRPVVAASSLSTVMDAMRSMSEEGVSSVAVVDEESGILIGGVSVTDIGRVVVPSQSNQILGTPLKYFVTSIKLPDGETDGADKYPVYSVFPSSSLAYTIEKLLATNARRLFVADEEESMNTTMSASSPGNLTGVISILDVLSVFAHLARIPDVDPRRMQRHRRASSTSSRSSSRSDRDRELDQMFPGIRARSTSAHRSPSFGAAVMSSPSPSAVTFSGGNSPVGIRPKSPAILPGAIPDIGGALGGSMVGAPLGRRGSRAGRR